MMRILGAILLFLLSGAVALVTLVAMFLINVTGAPRPDGPASEYAVSADGRVELDGGAPYELGMRPDTSHPDYAGGTRLAPPSCSVTDPAGRQVDLVDVVAEPTLNPFTRYARFVSTTAGAYDVRCAAVSPVPGTVLVIDDVWVSSRAEADARRTRLIVTGLVGLVATVGLAAAGARVAARRPAGGRSRSDAPGR